MPDQTDPFTLVHGALWTALTTFDDWAALVRPGNRVRFDAGGTGPAKASMDSLQPGDFPEVVLLQGPFEWAPFTLNAAACGLTQTYPLVLTARDYNIVPLNALKWQTLRALVKAGGHLGMPELVRRVTVRDGTDDAHGRQPWKRGGQRWATLLAIVVEMTIDKADVLAGTVPGA